MSRGTYRPAEDALRDHRCHCLHLCTYHDPRGCTVKVPGWPALTCRCVAFKAPCGDVVSNT